jgi:hypothetical protein
VRTTSLPRRALRALTREPTEPISPEDFAAASFWRQLLWILARQDPFYGATAPAEPLFARWTGEVDYDDTDASTLVCCVDADDNLRGIALLLDADQVETLGSMLLEPQAPNDWPEPAAHSTPVETVGALLASGRIEGEASITGTVIRLDQRINKAGNRWAVVTVDDGSGSVEAHFFPKTWQQVHLWLRLGEEFTISGRINAHHGEISLFGTFAVQFL